MRRRTRRGMLSLGGWDQTGLDTSRCLPSRYHSREKHAAYGPMATNLIGMKAIRNVSM